MYLLDYALSDGLIRIINRGGLQQLSVVTLNSLHKVNLKKYS